MRSILRRAPWRRVSDIVRWQPRASRRSRVIAADRGPEFERRGFNRRRPFFPHRTRILPSPGVDGLHLADRLLGERRADRLWEVVLSALPPALDGLPPALFFDDEIVWHRRQFGDPGHVALAVLAVGRQDIHALLLGSDVVQRIGRRRELKTVVERRFRSWPHMLLNSMMAHALELGKRHLLVPTADLVIRHTDPARSVDPSLFRRVYDRPVQRFEPERSGDWWRVDVLASRDRVVVPTVEEEWHEAGPTICVFHDTERGLGHRGESFEPMAERNGREALPRMLEVEARAGVAATYNVVGTLLDEVAPVIEAAGGAAPHAVAFHSYDHHIGRPQLGRCRDVDYRLPGYRPPQSRIGRDLTDRNLALHNFTWLASSRESLGHEVPTLERRVVKIPILTDDFPLFAGALDYEAWERDLLRRIGDAQFAAIGLHDCYGPWWLPRYEGLLARLADLRTLRTMDEVAEGLLLDGAR